MTDNSISWLALQLLSTFLGTLTVTQGCNLIAKLGLIPITVAHISVISLALIGLAYWLIWAYSGVNLENPKAKNLLYYGVPFVGLIAFLLGLI